MQRLIHIDRGTNSRLLGCGCLEIVGVVGLGTPVAVALFRARSFGMRLFDGLRVDLRAAYYAATQSAAGLLRRVLKPGCSRPRTGWHSAEPKRPERRTASR